MKHFILAGGLAVGAVAPSFASACTLALNNGGTLTLSMDGFTLGSEEPGGTGAALLIASLGSATVQVGAPMLLETPSGYNDQSDLVSVRYLGIGGLSGVLQDYTDQTTSFSIGLLPLTTLAIDARVDNPASFESGTYRLKTVVTCY